LPFGAETLFVLPLVISPAEVHAWPLMNVTPSPSNTHHTNRDATAIDRDNRAFRYHGETFYLVLIGGTVSISMVTSCKRSPCSNEARSFHTALW
jgi:hypothetical protein